MVSRRPAIVIPMQQMGMAGGETTLSREINPRDRRCFQRIISFGSESWPPASYIWPFSLSLSSLSFSIYAKFILVVIFLPILAILSWGNLTFCYKIQVNEIYLTILGFRESQLFKERAKLSLERVIRRAYELSRTVINRRSRTGRTVMVLRVKTGQGWRKK